MKCSRMFWSIRVTSRAPLNYIINKVNLLLQQLVSKKINVTGGGYD